MGGLSVSLSVTLLLPKVGFKGGCRKILIEERRCQARASVVSRACDNTSYALPRVVLSVSTVCGRVS